jgi:hypothetical protein
MNKINLQFKEPIKILCESYKLKEQIDKDTQEKKVILEGIAITFGKPTRNRVSYTYKSGIEKHKTLIGKPFLDTHHDDSIHLYPPYGHVANCFSGINPKNNLPCLMYEVDIDPEEKVFIRKAKRGDIAGTSIQVLVDEVEDKQDMLGNYIEANIREYLELSAVLIPGDGDSSMKIAEKFHKMKKEMIDVSIDEDEKRKPVTDFLDKRMSISEKEDSEKDLEEINIDKPIRLIGECGRKTEVAFKGCHCPVCSKQMLKDTYGESFQLRCWACDYIIKQKR